MLAEVSITTVTANCPTRIKADGPANAITRVAKTEHFNAMHTREAPGAARIHTHSTGSTKSRSSESG